MDQIEVQIFELESGKRVLECLAGLVWRMVVIAQLGGDEDVFALYSSSVEHLLQALANLSLIAIHFSSVDVLHQIQALSCQYHHSVASPAPPDLMSRTYGHLALASVALHEHTGRHALNP